MLLLTHHFGAFRLICRNEVGCEEWTRNLSEKILIMTDELVRKAEVRSLVRSETPSEREVIEVAAETQKNIILEHRRVIHQLCLGQPQQALPVDLLRTS